MATDRKSATMTVRATGRNCSYLFTYTIYANGIVDLKADYTANISNLRRIGMQMLMPGELSNVKYYARGPWANYIDRHTGSFLGEYTTTVADMNEYYLRPQTMGNRQDLRSLEMTNPETGNGIRVDAEGEVAFSTLYWSDVQLKPKATIGNSPFRSGLPTAPSTRISTTASLVSATVVAAQAPPMPTSSPLRERTPTNCASRRSAPCHRQSLA